MNVVASALANNGGTRSVLLVDVHSRTRESRAQNLRKLGATVDCVSTAVMALAQFASGFYRLVLIDLGRDVEAAEQLASDIRMKNPKQLVAFLVAGPTLISKTLGHPAQPTPVVTEAELIGESDVPVESEFGRRIREMEQRTDSAK
jgi:CheY-like chemotaxis protein